MSEERPLFNLVRWIAALSVGCFAGGIAALACGLVSWAFTQNQVLAWAIAGVSGLSCGSLLGRFVIKRLRMTSPASGSGPQSSSALETPVLVVGYAGALVAIVAGLPMLETRAGLASASIGGLLLVLLTTGLRPRPPNRVDPK